MKVLVSHFSRGGAPTAVSPWASSSWTLRARGLAEPKASAQLAMPPAQKPTGAEDAESALTREQPVTAAAATPTPVNNESAGAEGAEFIAQDLPQDPPGNDDLLI